MKVSLSLATLLWLAAPVTAQEWVPFSSARGNFRAVFPTRPQESVQTIDTPLGRIPYTTCMAELAGGNVAYGVAYNDYPNEILQTDPEKVLDGGRDGAKENLGGAIVSETRLTIHGHPGREFTILSEVQGQKLFYHTRVFLIGTRLYQMQIVRVGDVPVDVADVVRFFASFEPLQP